MVELHLNLCFLCFVCVGIRQIEKAAELRAKEELRLAERAQKVAEREAAKNAERLAREAALEQEREAQRHAAAEAEEAAQLEAAAQEEARQASLKAAAEAQAASERAKVASAQVNRVPLAFLQMLSWFSFPHASVHFLRTRYLLACTFCSLVANFILG